MCVSSPLDSEKKHSCCRCQEQGAGDVESLVYGADCAFCRGFNGAVGNVDEEENACNEAADWEVNIEAWGSC